MRPFFIPLHGLRLALLIVLTFTPTLVLSGSACNAKRGEPFARPLDIGGNSNGNARIIRRRGVPPIDDAANTPACSPPSYDTAIAPTSLSTPFPNNPSASLPTTFTNSASIPAFSLPTPQEMYAAPSASAQASLLPAERLVRQMTVTAKLDAHVGSFTTWHSDGPFLAIGLLTAVIMLLLVALKKMRRPAFALLLSDLLALFSAVFDISQRDITHGRPGQQVLALAVIAQLLAAFATAARFVWLALLCQASAPFWTDDLQAEVGPPACLDSPSRTALTGPDADLAFSHCPTPPPTNGFIKRQITDHFALPSPALLSGDPTWAKVAAALFVLLIGVLDLCWRIVLLSDLERAAPVMRASSAFQLVALLACSVVLVYVMWRAGRAHKAQSEPLGPFERPAVSSLDPALTTSAGRFPAAIGLALVGNVFGIAVTCADEAILGFSEAPAGRLLWAFQMMFYLSAALAICFIGRDTSMREPGPWATSSNVAGDRTAVRIYPSARSTLSTARWSEKQPESHGQSGRSISTDELREWCAPTREQEMRRVFSTVGERMKHGLRHFALGRRSRGRVEVAPAPERARAQDTPRVLPPLPRPSASSVFAELVEEYGHGPARPWVDVPSNVSMRSSQAAEGGHSPPATPLSHTSGVVMEAISAKPAAPRFLMFVQPYRNAASFDVQHSSIKDVKFDADLECMETSAKRTLRPHSIAVSHPRQERPKTNHILDFRCPPAAAASHKPRSRSDANAVPATTQMAALAPTTDEAVDLSIDVARQDRQERQDTLALTLDNRATVPRLRVPSPLRVTTSYSDEEGDQEMKHVVDDDASEIHSDEIVEIGRGRRFRGADANEYRESYGSHVTVTSFVETLASPQTLSSPRRAFTELAYAHSRPSSACHLGIPSLTPPPRHSNAPRRSSTESRLSRLLHHIAEITDTPRDAGTRASATSFGSSLSPSRHSGQRDLLAPYRPQPQSSSQAAMANTGTTARSSHRLSRSLSVLSAAASTAGGRAERPYGAPRVQSACSSLNPISVYGTPPSTPLAYLSHSQYRAETDPDQEEWYQDCEQDLERAEEEESKSASRERARSSWSSV